MPNPIQTLEHLKALLRQEYDYEKQEYRRQTETMGIGRKVKRGLCWYPVATGRSYYNSINQLVIEVLRQQDKDIEHNFEFGRPVSFFTQDGSGGPRGEGLVHHINFVGTVSYVDDDRMVIVLPNEAALAQVQETERLGVQLYFDETTYRLMFEAIERVIAAKGNRLAQLRDIVHGSQPATRFTFDAVRFPWLNPSQEQAVNNVLWAKDVAIVHGPPGTGKTTTLVEAIYETLRRESQVLVCAQSNMAVDWISEKLVDRGVSVLRIGNPTRVNDKMLSFTYERRFADHPLYPDLWAVRKTIRQLHSQKGPAEARHQKIARLRDRATELELRINEAIFSQARVIASTLTGAASRQLISTQFGTLFVDEAAQALEPACWIAMQKAHRVILAGDHQQLPPTIKCYEAMLGGLDRTLIQALAENKPQVVTLLQVQYRMNEAIMRFSSDYFYQGLVQSAPEVRHRGILDFDTSMTWIDTSNPSEFFESSKSLNPSETSEPSQNSQQSPPTAAPTSAPPQERFVGENYGRINEGEAQLTLRALQSYIARVGRQRMLDERIDIGLISPYKAQVQYLRQLIRHSEFLRPYRSLITVGTVDGFQGQERDVIVISLVRANEQGQIGFLADLRRMNVAITRARQKVIILGDVPTLSHNPFYRRLYHYIQAL
jgi:ATP-dependent RNA/DNA helicase IGHMBP2